MENFMSVQHKDKSGLNFKKLARLAISMGASDARIIASQEISVEDRLAKLCNEPRCEGYGLSPSCPPYVSGPSGFRELQRALKHAMAVRIIVPSAVLYSAERRDIGRLLHEVVAGVEREAVGMGYRNSKAFAAGSCKKIFCHEHSQCRRLSEKGECRHPQYARPSMSGFGINVSKLMKSCGWPADINAREVKSKPDSMTWLAGLILID
jgi:predicted metal-binding protein